MFDFLSHSSELVGMLIERGADVSARDYVRAPHGPPRAPFVPLAFRCVMTTLTRRRRLQLGQTPLHYAAKAASPRIVEVLLQHGANPQAKDRYYI